MTGLVVDVFNNEVFIFADGRVTDDDFVFTDTYKKIVKLNSNSMIAMCGDVSLLDNFVNLVKYNEHTEENLNKIKDTGSIIFATNSEVVVFDFDKKADIVEHWSISYDFTMLPIFLGSGERSLSGAYYAIEPRMTSTRRDYIENMRRVFKSAATRVISMGQLYQVESLKIDKKKEKAK